MEISRIINLKSLSVIGIYDKSYNNLFHQIKYYLYEHIKKLMKWKSRRKDLFTQTFMKLVIEALLDNHLNIPKLYGEYVRWC